MLNEKKVSVQDIAYIIHMVNFIFLYKSVCVCVGKCTEKVLEEYTCQLLILVTSREEDGIEETVKIENCCFFFPAMGTSV